MNFEFTINNKPFAQGMEDLKTALAAGFKDGLEAVGEAMLERARTIVQEGYTRGYGWRSGGGGSTRWPFLSDATKETYARILGVKPSEITAETHKGLIHPDESRELLSSLKKGGLDNVFVVSGSSADGFLTEVRVGSTVIYAGVHEFGALIYTPWSVTGFVVIPPRPYLSTAVYTAKDDGKLDKAFARAVAKRLEAFDEQSNR